MPVLIRRRPLLRAAAIGGGAYYAGKRRQEAHERDLDKRAQIGQLGRLHAQGALTDEELASQKARLLDG